MHIDSRALRVLTDWSAKEYKNEGQKAASLQVLIIDALKVQDAKTRHACAEAVLCVPERCETPTGGSAICPDEAHAAVMNTQAIE